MLKPPPLPTANRSYIVSLTSLRGIAAILVMLLHFNIFFPVIKTLWVPIDKNQLWVDFFFILSGFVITLSYGQYFERHFDKKEYPVFLWKRFLRIYPVHFATLIAMALTEMYRVSVYNDLHTVLPDLVEHPLFGDTGARGLPSFIANLFLVQTWGLHKSLSWNTPSWSISCEFVAYLLFPLLIMFFHRTHKVATMFCVLLFGYYQLIAFDATGSDVNSLVARCLLGFSCGILLYRLYSEHPSPWIILRQDWFVAALLAICVFHYNGYFDDFDYIPLFCLLVISTAYNRGKATRFLTHPVLLYLGKISYSVYLVHFVMLNFLDLLVLRYLHMNTGSFPFWENLGLFAAFFAITLVIASISYHYLELKLPAALRPKVKRDA